MFVDEMKIAVLADIHGNLLALEAVVRDLGAESPDLVVNLGDHVSGPLWAAETADLLMSKTDWVQIRGNHDRQVVETPVAEMGLSDRAAAERISGRQREWLSELPVTSEVADGVLLCHGTPSKDDEYLTEDVASGFSRLAASEEIRARLGGATGLILCGHSHVARFVSVGEKTIVGNPGSVGLPAYDDSEHRWPHVMEVGSPHARYLRLEGDGKRGWRAAFRVVDYDWEGAAKLAERGRRTEWAHALRTGYMGASTS